MKPGQHLGTNVMRRRKSAGSSPLQSDLKRLAALAYHRLESSEDFVRSFARFRRIDYPEQHAQDRGLAGTVGTEQAVDRARRDGQADAVDGAGFVEVLDEVDGLDGERFGCCGWDLSKH